jgi:hypothetical protein
MGEQKKENFELKGELDRIDKQAKIKNLSPLEWEQRYYTKRQLERIYLRAEIYWKQRARKCWLAAGDSIQSFFTNVQMAKEEKSLLFLWKLSRDRLLIKRRLWIMWFNFISNSLGIMGQGM